MHGLVVLSANVSTTQFFDLWSVCDCQGLERNLLIGIRHEEGKNHRIPFSLSFPKRVGIL